MVTTGSLCSASFWFYEQMIIAKQTNELVPADFDILFFQVRQQALVKVSGAATFPYPPFLFN